MGITMMGRLFSNITSDIENWYNMHVEVSRTLHALEVGEMCHT